MVDTNALLNIAFSMIANFAGIVHIPLEALPQQPGDLERCVIGRLGTSPVDLYLVHHRGTEFWIRRGAVATFSRPGSFFSAQDPAQLPLFAGSTSLTSNDVVQIATIVVKQLVKRGDPLANGPPSVQFAGYYRGKRIPFFRVSWPSAPGAASDLAAQVEIDGRTSDVVRLSLWDAGFFDTALADEIKRKVYTTDFVGKTTAGDNDARPRPATSEVAVAIANWLRFCSKLKLDCGDQTNTVDVDWSKTFLYTNGMCSGAVALCRVSFQNGTLFDSVQGVPLNHFAADVFLTGNHPIKPSATWKKLEETVHGKWEPLASGLQGRICEEFSVPASMFANAQPTLNMVVPETGERKSTRASIWWRKLPPIPNGNNTDEYFRSFLRVEFDLDTQQAKSVCFNPQFLPYIRTALRQPK